jgi:hypothetical protein
MADAVELRIFVTFFRLVGHFFSSWTFLPGRQLASQDHSPATNTKPSPEIRGESANASRGSTRFARC